ncbi:MAG: M24 family metallopeptidase, partial [Candidatus Omnitrophica bacterium]|nr:M24 family metallopeptidase [Candidatus Omnitrophota bacterium]
GKSERDIYEHLEKFIKAHKVGFSFSPIVASGPNAALPHAKITDRKFKANDVVLVDMGIDVKGYKSDLTRMFFLGKIPELVKTVHTHVDTAKNLAIETIRSGISVAKVDQQARKYLEKNKLSKYFGHALGHGVGLEIHENPRLSQKSREILEEGMIVTVEPGVYLPNKFGIRLEEMVLVTKSGCEILSDNIH